MFDIDRLRDKADIKNRYEIRLEKLQASGISTNCIEVAVAGAVHNVVDKQKRSFVIYGEPQSGKTEMMIALTAKLLDEGKRIIIHLLNDSVQLLDQNLDRFKRSGLAPSPKSHQEVLDPSISLGSGEWVIFCKKNSRDLQRLIEKFDEDQAIIVIDDEADYATPNAKINVGEQTKINELIGKLLGDDGVYIGVTATPARLDLNNTFMNQSDIWINFPPHDHYTGQDVFFPANDDVPYRLNFISATGDHQQQLRAAICRFLASVAHVNLYKNAGDENYTMLIHTSGKKVDHAIDRHYVEELVNELSDPSSPGYEPLARQIWDHAEEQYPGYADDIVAYVLRNISRNNIVTMNSARSKNVDLKSATSPAALFTFAIGGNIVSRGVTFENLLSMYFTRDVKSKLQQDTYIQRARMFGARGKFLDHFELTIPRPLFIDWQRCFVFHRLALSAINDGKGSPVWLANRRVTPVAKSSIDQSTVSMDSGEMGFRLFDYDAKLDAIVEDELSVFAKLEKIQRTIGEECLPDYLLSFIRETLPAGEASIAIHPSSDISGYKDAEGLDKSKIERKRGFIGEPQKQRSKFPQAIHHLKIFFNGEGRARLIYKFDGNVQFIKNVNNL